MEWYLDGMTGDEITNECEEIIKLFGVFGIKEKNIELVMMTKRCLAEENYIKNVRKSSRDEIGFISEICREFMINCIIMMWEEGRFHCEHMSKILKCSRDKVYPYHQKVRWGVNRRKYKRQSMWELDDDGKIKFAGYSTQ